MAWTDAKAEIQTILAAISVTTPVAQTIAKVYANPPATVQDLPCFIIYPPALDVERTPGLRLKTYKARLRLLVSDEDLDQAAAFVDSYREATIDAFDDNLTLNGKASLIRGPSILEAASYQYGGRAYTGMDAILTVQLREGKVFAP